MIWPSLWAKILRNGGRESLELMQDLLHPTTCAWALGSPRTRWLDRRGHRNVCGGWGRDLSPPPVVTVRGLTCTHTGSEKLKLLSLAADGLFLKQPTHSSDDRSTLRESISYDAVVEFCGWVARTRTVRFGCINSYSVV